MSYIPKYIVKRLLPADCIKKVATGIEITAINVLSPGQIMEIPDNPKDILDAFEVKVDGQLISDAIKKSLIITINDQTLPLSDLKKLEGQDLALGAIIKVFVPITSFNKGEEHLLDASLIKARSPMHIEVKRTIQ